MDEPDPEAERIRQAIIDELFPPGYLLPSRRFRNEYRLSPSHATILGFIRKADDHLYPSFEHFRKDLELPWEGWAP